MNIKEKKPVAPNEASFLRWIGVLMVGSLISIPLYIPVALLLWNRPGSFLGVDYPYILQLLVFAAQFVGLVLAIRFVGKTSLKDFVLGVGGKVNRKECLMLLGLYVVGAVLAILPTMGNIRLRGVSAGEFAGLFLVMLLLLWMQTTYEELVFRGLLIRWACKNKVGFTKKAVMVSAATAAAFALAHAGNPEVTTLSGIRVVMGIASYGISGLMYFVTDLYFGSLLPGILIHWLNNLLSLTLISEEVSVLAVPTLLIDTTPHSAEGMLMTKILLWLPVLVYILLDVRKKKKRFNNS